jgi:hypothetical protein
MHACVTRCVPGATTVDAAQRRAVQHAGVRPPMDHDRKRIDTLRADASETKTYSGLVRPAKTKQSTMNAIRNLQVRKQWEERSLACVGLGAYV